METAGITRDYDDPDPTCARCGSPCEWVECRDCGGNGYTHHMRCETCWGDGWWWECISDAAWCEAHPLPGREGVERGNVEVIQ